MGVAGTAPSYSISATMATLIAAVGVLAPASLLYGGLCMFGIVCAFVYLNRVDANAGAAYAWVARVFHPDLGFFTGWTLVVASALFMVAATIPAANATLLLFAPAYVGNLTVVVLVAAAWLVAVTAVVIAGIVLTSRVQLIMTVTELAVLAAVIGAAFLHWQPDASAWQWRLLLPTSFDFRSFAQGMVIALFFFWGWDVALNLSEETRDAGRTPGAGALVAMGFIIAAFVGFAAAAVITLSLEEIRASGTNVIFAVAERFFPAPWGYLAILAVMLSTVGTLETSIVQFSRTLFAQSRDGMLHPGLARIHPGWRTPYVATALIGALGLALLALSLLFESVEAALKASIEAIGVQAAVYYGLAAVACAWHFWPTARHRVHLLIVQVVWPAVSALALWLCAAEVLATVEVVTVVICLGTLGAGIIPLVLRRARGA